MRLVPLLILVPILLAPFTVAAPIPPCVGVDAFGACAFDVHGGEGSCDTTGYEQDATLIFVGAGPAAGAGVTGAHYCSGWHDETATGRYDATLVMVGASSEVAGTGVLLYWQTSSSSGIFGDTDNCYLLLMVDTPVSSDVHDPGCVAGDAPNLGWGDVLPLL